jgi:hypothetical protein
MINVPDVTLENMKVTGDLIIGDGVGAGDITLNNDFTSPVEYMITAEDGTTVVYTVTVRRR